MRQHPTVITLTATVFITLRLLHTTATTTSHPSVSLQPQLPSSTQYLHQQRPVFISTVCLQPSITAFSGNTHRFTSGNNNTDTSLRVDLFFHHRSIFSLASPHPSVSLQPQLPTYSHILPAAAPPPLPTASFIHGSTIQSATIQRPAPFPSITEALLCFPCSTEHYNLSQQRSSPWKHCFPATAAEPCRVNDSLLPQWHPHLPLAIFLPHSPANYKHSYTSASSSNEPPKSPQ